MRRRGGRDCVGKPDREQDEGHEDDQRSHAPAPDPLAATVARTPPVSRQALHWLHTTPVLSEAASYEGVTPKRISGPQTAFGRCARTLSGQSTEPAPRPSSHAWRDRYVLIERPSRVAVHRQPRFGSGVSHEASSEAPHRRAGVRRRALRPGHRLGRHHLDSKGEGRRRRGQQDPRQPRPRQAEGQAQPRARRPRSFQGDGRGAVLRTRVGRRRVLRLPASSASATSARATASGRPARTSPGARTVSSRVPRSSSTTGCSRRDTKPSSSPSAFATSASG